MTVQLKDGKNILRDSIVTSLLVTILPDNVQQVIPSGTTNYDGYVNLKISNVGLDWSKLDKKIKIEGKPNQSSRDARILAEGIDLPVNAYAQSIVLPFYKEGNSNGTNEPLFHVKSLNGNGLRGTAMAGKGDGVVGHLLDNPNAEGFTAVAGWCDDLGSFAIWGQNNKSGSGGRIGDQWHSAYFWGKPMRIDANGNTLLLLGKEYDRKNKGQNENGSTYIEFYPIGSHDPNFNPNGGRKGWIGYDRYCGEGCLNWDLEMINEAGDIRLSTNSNIVYSGVQHAFNGSIKANNGLVVGGGLEVNGETYSEDLKGHFFVWEGVKEPKANYDVLDLDDKTKLNFAIKSQNILCSQLAVRSDLRIKSNVSPYDINKSLNVLKKLYVKDYTLQGIRYSDKKGFIAQEVEQVFPEAVSKTTDFIPNVYQLAKKVQYNPADKTLSLTVDSLSEIQEGDKIRIIADQQRDVIVSNVIGTTITVIEWPQPDTKEAFLFGKEVNDFRVVDYDRIFTLNVSATQALIAKVETLEEKVTRLETENDMLKGSTDEMLKRLEALEASIGGVIKANETNGRIENNIGSQKK